LGIAGGFHFGFWIEKLVGFSRI
jgi:hypothetical protein